MSYRIALLFAAGAGAAYGDDKPRLVVQLGHPDGFFEAALSGDSRSLVTRGPGVDALIRWDVPTGRQLATLRLGDGFTSPPVAAPDGTVRRRRVRRPGLPRRLRHREGRLQIRGAEQGGPQRRVHPHGRHLLTTGDDAPLRVFDAGTGQLLKTYPVPPRAGKMTASRGGTTAFVWDYREGVLLDLATGNVLRTFAGASGNCVRAAFGPGDAEIVIRHSDHTIRAWDPAVGEVAVGPVERRRLAVPATSNFPCLAVAPDGRTVLTCERNDSVRLSDPADGKLVREFGRGDKFVWAAFADGKTVLAATLASVRLYDATGGEKARVAAGREGGGVNHVLSLDVSPDGGRLLASNKNGTVAVWDLAAGRVGRTVGVPGTEVARAVFSPDGTQILAACGDNVVRLWDADTGKLLRTFRGHASGGVYACAFGPDGTRVYSGGYDQSFRAWDAATAEEIYSRPRLGAGVRSIAISPDGRLAAVGLNSEPRPGRDPGRGDGPPAEAARNARRDLPTPFSPDGDRIAVPGPKGTAVVAEVATGKALASFDVFDGRVSATAFSPEGTRVLAGGLTRHHEAKLFRVADGKCLTKFVGHDGEVTCFAYVRGRFPASGSRDGTVRVWHPATGRELCRLVAFDDGTWAVVDPDGRYDASGGDAAGLHWVVGDEPVALAQLKERYYEPKLLAKVLGFDKEPLREVAAFANPKLDPALELGPFDGGKFAVALTNRGGGIGKVVVRVNGKEMASDARPRGSDPDARRLELTVDVAGDPRVEPGKTNRVEVVAYNADGSLAGRGAVREFDAEGAAEVEKPALWAVVCGVSDYRGDKIDLKYAAKDADDFAAALEIGGLGLFGKGRVHVARLTTTEAKTPPTRDNLVAALRALRASKPADVVVVYLAGHGVGRGGEYYYLTADAASADPTDPEVRRTTSVSSGELADALRLAPARKQALILDTCASGTLADRLTEKREASGSQVRGLEA